MGYAIDGERDLRFFGDFDGLKVEDFLDDFGGLHEGTFVGDLDFFRQVEGLL